MCVWRRASPLLEGGPPCPGKYGKCGAWLNVKCKSWGQAQPQPSSLPCLSTAIPFMDQFAGGVAYLVCPFKQEQWPKIFWCYEILLHLFLPRCRERRWGPDDFRQWGRSLLEASSIFIISWLCSVDLPCFYDIFFPNWGDLSMTYWVTPGKSFKRSRLDPNLSWFRKV